MHRSLGLLVALCVAVAMVTVSSSSSPRGTALEARGTAAGGWHGNAEPWLWLRGRFVLPPPATCEIRFESGRYGFGCNHVELPVAQDGSFLVRLDPRWLGLAIVIAADAKSSDGAVRFSYSDSSFLSHVQTKETIELGDLVLTAEASLARTRRN